MIELGLPRNPRFLVNTIWLAALFIGLYYSWPRLHQHLDSVYNDNFWYVVSFPTSENIEVSLQLPKHVSTLVEREVVLTVTNLDSSEWITPTIVIRAGSSSQLGISILLQPTESLGQDYYTGSTIFSFDPIPPHGQVTTSAWVRVDSRYQEQDIDFQVFLNNRFLDSGGMSTKANVDLNKTIWQGIVQFLLLPPFANLFLPALALFLSLLYEGWAINNRFYYRSGASDNELDARSRHDRKDSEPDDNAGPPSPDNSSDDVGDNQQEEGAVTPSEVSHSVQESRVFWQYFTSIYDRMRLKLAAGEEWLRKVGWQYYCGRAGGFLLLNLLGIGILYATVTVAIRALEGQLGMANVFHFPIILLITILLAVLYINSIESLSLLSRDYRDRKDDVSCLDQLDKHIAELENQVQTISTLDEERQNQFTGQFEEYAQRLTELDQKFTNNSQDNNKRTLLLDDRLRQTGEDIRHIRERIKELHNNEEMEKWQGQVEGWIETQKTQDQRLAEFTKELASLKEQLARHLIIVIRQYQEEENRSLARQYLKELMEQLQDNDELLEKYQDEINNFSDWIEPVA